MWKWLGRIVCAFKGHQWNIPDDLAGVLSFIESDHECPRCGYIVYGDRSSLIPDCIYKEVMKRYVNPQKLTSTFQPAEVD